MTIIQGLIASISKGAEAAPPPTFNPIDSNVSMGPNWTVEIVADMQPINFWASIWGNESWNEGLGHLAFLNSTTYLNVGAPNAYNEYVLAQDVAVKSHWVFTHVDGGGVNVYRNGVLLTPNATGYNQPSGPANNTLLFGSRHNNDGTGSTDTIGSANFYYYNVESQAQTAEQVAANYENIRSSYGI